MTIYLALQSTYTAIEIGLFNDKSIIKTITIDKFKASATLIPEINVLLDSNSYTLSDLSFIAVNQGPAPFTTLRVTIATANGISFASQIPLIGIDALHSLLSMEYAYPTTVVMLNAFNNDVYVGMKQNSSIETGCYKAAHFLSNLAAKKSDEPIEFIGNAVSLYESTIQELLSKRAIINHPIIEYTPLETIAHTGFERWQAKERIAHQLFPLYLKSANPV